MRLERLYPNRGLLAKLRPDGISFTNSRRVYGISLPSSLKFSSSSGLSHRRAVQTRKFCLPFAFYSWESCSWLRRMALGELVCCH
jgi:hypothetical protein